DESRTCGGSSGGSAAAVVLGMATLALRTDGGGSIRIPAGFCGCVGLKPTFGMGPTWPVSPFGSLAHTGPMTRTVADTALMMDVIAKPDARDWSALPDDGMNYSQALAGGVKGLRIAYIPQFGSVQVDREVALAVKLFQFHERFDLLLTPTLPIPAFEAGHEVPQGWPGRRWQNWTPFTYPFNLTQQPAISVLCGMTTSRLPIGLQLIGAKYRDA